METEKSPAAPARKKDKKSVFRISIIIIWLVFMGWLIRYEAFPEYFTNTLAGYKGMLSKNIMLVDSWMRILVDDQPIGYSHTGMKIRETEPAKYYEMKNTIHIRLNIMGAEQDIRVNTTSYLDKMYQLQEFSFHMMAGRYIVNISAEHVKDRVFDVTISTSASEQKTQVTIPEDVIIYSPITGMTLKNLSPGQQLTIITFDPSTMSTIKVIAEALRKEKITINGEEYETTLISSEVAGAEVLTWIDSVGSVVRQKTPFGWVMEKSTDDDALASLKIGGHSGDIMSRMAVKSLNLIKNPKESTRIKYRLIGVKFDKSELESNRQSVGELAENEVWLSVDQARFPTFTNGLEPESTQDADAESFQQYLESTIAVQSDHPDIVKTAGDIIKDASTRQEKAEAIFNWVFKTLKKEIIVSLPSALDVLREKRGDCNEHTYLFTALARAAGIPTKIKVGIVYQNEMFYYHAWPAVYLGDWVEMDPTWGQKEVDATHIAFVEGEIQNQVQLLKIMGKLSIEVIEESND